jgi:hypothetical protein
VPRAKTSIVYVFGFVIKFNADRVDLDTLEERFFWLLPRGDDADRIVFKFKEASKEVESVLIDVETKGQDICLYHISKSSENGGDGVP